MNHKPSIAQPIRWGIIGAGRIAHTFAGDIGYAPSARLDAIASRSLHSADSFAAQYQLPKSYASYQQLYKDPDIDAIYIATPHSHHRQQASDAMRAGKAVLCEKPLCVSAQETTALMQVQQQTGSYLMEGMWTHFLPALHKAQQWVSDGRIGNIKHIKADFAYPQLPFDASRREYDKDLAGGALLEMGIYPIAIAWFFLQQDPNSMQVSAGMATNGVEDDITMIFEYADATATLATSFRCKMQNYCYVIGDQGTIVIPDFIGASECHLYELDTLVDSFTAEREAHGFNYEIEAASQDILAQRSHSTIMPLSSSLKFQQHMDKVRRFF